MIDKSFFLVGDLAIPNAQQQIVSDPNLSSEDDLSFFIDVEKRNILISGLGFEVYKRFDDLFVNNVLPINADENAIRLLNGYEYEIDGVKYIWNGLVYQVGNAKQSLIAYWIYYNFLNNDYQKYFTTGVSDLQSNGATKVSPDQKLVNAYRKFHSMYQSNVKYDYDTDYFYGGYLGGLNKSREVSLCRYIYDQIRNDETLNDGFYKGWEFDFMDNINSFGV